MSGRQIEITRDELDMIDDGLANILDEVEIDTREAYSGRGMYGNTCIGWVPSSEGYFGTSITGPAFGAALFMVLLEYYNENKDKTEEDFESTDLFDELMDDGERAIMDIVSSISEDSMGMSTIYYSRRLSLKEKQ